MPSTVLGLWGEADGQDSVPALRGLESHGGDSVCTNSHTEGHGGLGAQRRVRLALTVAWDAA